MGMFDRYEPRPGLSCPSCGWAVSEWQGQSGPCCLFEWVQGHAAPMNERVEEGSAPSRLPDHFEIYAWCVPCDHWVDALGFCEAGVWTRTERICPLKQADLPDDWLPIGGNESLCALDQLRREMPTDHVLAARRLFPVAHHREREELLVRTIGTDAELWLVHLTWRSGPNPEWPQARAFRDVADFVARQDRVD